MRKLLLLLAVLFVAFCGFLLAGKVRGGGAEKVAAVASSTTTSVVPASPGAVASSVPPTSGATTTAAPRKPVTTTTVRAASQASVRATTAPTAGVVAKTVTVAPTTTSTAAGGATTTSAPLRPATTTTVKPVTTTAYVARLACNASSSGSGEFLSGSRLTFYVTSNHPAAALTLATSDGATNSVTTTAKGAWQGQMAVTGAPGSFWRLVVTEDAEHAGSCEVSVRIRATPAP